jgi:hypothetical protein
MQSFSYNARTCQHDTCHWHIPARMLAGLGGNQAMCGEEHGRALDIKNSLDLRLERAWGLFPLPRSSSSLRHVKIKKSVHALAAKQGYYHILPHVLTTSRGDTCGSHGEAAGSVPESWTG